MNKKQCRLRRVIKTTLLCSVTMIAVEYFIEILNDDFKQSDAQEVRDISPVNESWEALKLQAIERSSLLAAQNANTQARRAEVRAADRWMNPKIVYRFSPSPIETRDGPLVHSVSISQGLTWADDIERGMRLAQLRVDEVEGGLSDRKLQVIESLEVAMWSLWFNESLRQVLASELDVTDRLVAHIEGRVETGTQALSALAKVRYERQLKNESLGQVSVKIKEYRLRLGLILEGGGRFTASPPLNMIDATLSRCVQTESLVKTLKESTQSIDEQSSPIVQQAVVRVRLASVSLDRLRVAQRPQLEFGLQWSAINELSLLGGLKDDVLTAQIGGTIPIWGSADRAAQEALRAEKSRREFELKDLSERWRFALDELTLQLREQSRQLAAFKRSLIPLAEAVIDQKRREYEANLTTLNEIYLAELSLYSLKREELKVQRDCALSLARWRSLTSSSLKDHHQLPSAKLNTEEVGQ